MFFILQTAAIVSIIILNDGCRSPGQQSTFKSGNIASLLSEHHVILGVKFESSSSRTTEKVEKVYHGSEMDDNMSDTKKPVMLLLGYLQNPVHYAGRYHMIGYHPKII
jgi:hypothetical protein